jgi:hypothetical protein
MALNFDIKLNTAAALARICREQRSVAMNTMKAYGQLLY